MSVKIEVKLLAHIAEEVGVKKIEIYTEKNLFEALREIEQKISFPLKEKLENGYGLLINGRSYQHFLQENLELKEGDKLVIFPILGGG